MKLRKIFRLNFLLAIVYLEWLNLKKPYIALSKRFIFSIILLLPSYLPLDLRPLILTPLSFIIIVLLLLFILITFLL
jgi:hypothetical protein